MVAFRLHFFNSFPYLSSTRHLSPSTPKAPLNVSFIRNSHSPTPTPCPSLSPFPFRSYFDSLAGKIVDAGHTLDVFACSLDQVGLAEMRTIVARTGGIACLAEEFKHDIFKRTLKVRG